MTKNTHGGRRAGSGRKPAESRKIPIAIKIDPEVREYLRTVPNQTAEIEAVIRRSKGFRDWKKTFCFP